MSKERKQLEYAPDWLKKIIFKVAKEGGKYGSRLDALIMLGGAAIWAFVNPVLGGAIIVVNGVQMVFSWKIEEWGKKGLQQLKAKQVGAAA